MFVRHVVELLKASAYDPTAKTEQLVSTLLGFAEADMAAVAFLISIDAITDLVTLYQSNRVPIFMKTLRPKHLPLVKLIALLALSCDNPTRDEEGAAPAPADNDGDLTPPPGGASSLMLTTHAFICAHTVRCDRRG